MGIGIGTLVAGVFGMNVSRQNRLMATVSRQILITSFRQLKSHFEDHDYAFYVMSVAAIAACTGAAWIGVRRYETIIRSVLCGKIAHLGHRLARIRKVGLSNGNRKKPENRRWNLFSLRGRRPDSWS